MGCQGPETSLEWPPGQRQSEGEAPPAVPSWTPENQASSYDIRFSNGVIKVSSYMQIVINT